VEADYSWVPGNFQTVVRTRTETDGVGIADTSRALLRVRRAIEQVRFKETSEKCYAYIKCDFGMMTF